MNEPRRKQGQKPSQKNIVDIEAPKSTYEGAHDGALGVVPTEEEFFPSVRQPIRLTNYNNKSKFLRKRKFQKDHVKFSVIEVLGASGLLLIPDEKLKEVSDPYIAGVRSDLADVLLLDPIAGPAARYSIGALFEDGFDLKLVPASKINTETGQQMTPEEIQNNVLTNGAQFSKILLQLDTWKSDCNVEQLAKDLHGVSLSQGKALGIIQPGILELEPEKLPQLCEILPIEDLSNPIIDAGITRRIVAMKLQLTEDELKERETVKDILRADEFVYHVVGIRGLRREAIFQGISPLEPVIQISKALKRVYHLDAPVALVAAYVTKLLIKVSKENTDDALQSRVSKFMSNLFKASTWAMAMPDWYEGVDPIQNKVDFPTFDGIENKLAVAELTAMGVPKSAVNREQDLNRDIATIQAIQFIRFTRKPAERAIAKSLENQLFNPLLSHLAGVPLKDIPFRIEIIRKEAEEGDIDKIFDSTEEQKELDLTRGNLQQNQAKAIPETVIGASGLDDELKKFQIKAYKKIIKKMDNGKK